MIYEFKKINQNKIITLLSLLCIFISIIFPLIFINGYETYDYSSGKEVAIHGLEGLNYKKNQVKKISGYIDQKFIKSIFEYADEFPSDNDLDYMKTEQRFPGMYYYLKNAYSPYGQEASFSFKDIEVNNTLTDAQKNKIKSMMYATGNSPYSTEEEIKILNFIENNKSPIKYDFADQWPIIIKSLIFSYYSIVILAIVMSSRLFSVENNTNMDKIIIQTNTKMRHRITSNKLKMFYGYIFGIYLICTLIILAIVIIPTGTDGLWSRIQVTPDLFISMYPWTIGEMLIKYIVEAFMCICAIGGVGILINSITRDEIGTIMLAIFFCVFPFLLKSPILRTNNFAMRLLYFFPISGVNVLNYLGSAVVYFIGTKVILPYYIIFGSSLILFIILNHFILKKSKGI